MEEAVLALEHRARAEKALAPEQGRAQARLRRPAGVQPLGPGALGEVLDDPRCHAAGDAERIGQLPRRQAERSTDPGGGAERADHRGRMEAGAMDRGRRDQREAAHQLGADDVAAQQVGARAAVALGGGEHRRQHHRAGMHRRALEAVVEVLAMRRGAVDEGSAGGIQAAAMAERGARALGVPGRERGADVVRARARRCTGPRRRAAHCARPRAPPPGSPAPRARRPSGEHLRDRRRPHACLLRPQSVPPAEPGRPGRALRLRAAYQLRASEANTSSTAAASSPAETGSWRKIAWSPRDSTSDLR